MQLARKGEMRTLPLCSSVVQWLRLLTEDISDVRNNKIARLSRRVHTHSLFGLMSPTRLSAVTESWWLNVKERQQASKEEKEKVKHRKQWDRRSPYRTSGRSTMGWVNTVVILRCTAAYLEGLRPVDAISGGCLEFSLCSHLSPLHLAVNLSHSPLSPLPSFLPQLLPSSPLLSLLSSLIMYVAGRKKNASSAKVLELKKEKKFSLISRSHSHHLIKLF